MNILWTKDKSRGGYLPKYQHYMRKASCAGNIITRKIYGYLFRKSLFKYNCEISYRTKIGEGLFIGHPFCITINPQVVIGKNCNIHKGVTIGQENRGERKGAPVIGDCVWIGVNATIVGKIKIGNDVLIAPNSYVNRDVPDHSIVFGNPFQIIHKENATDGYINNRV